MLILIVAYLGGVLTILSPCILPILPFVFAPTGRPFRSHTLPMERLFTITVLAL